MFRVRHLSAKETPRALLCLRAEDLYLTAAIVTHSVPHWFPAVPPVCQIPSLTKMEV